MSARTKAAAVVVLLIGVAALLLGLRSCSGDDAGGAPESAPTAEPSPTESLAAVQMSTQQIVDSIKSRLDERAGEATRVECPEQVEQKVGTTFECDVFFADQPGTAPVSTATVEIDGPDGAYSWEAVRNE